MFQSERMYAEVFKRIGGKGMRIHKLIDYKKCNRSRRRYPLTIKYFKGWIGTTEQIKMIFITKKTNDLKDLKFHDNTMFDTECGKEEWIYRNGSK